MTEETKGHRPDLIAMTGEIVAAYLSSNPVPVSEVPALIASIHATISGLASGAPGAAGKEPVERPTPAQIRKSITHDALISFIDGKSYKTLKRHLTAHGLTPEKYRTRYGLPADYPITAPSYSAQRSALAKAISLGVPGAQAKNAQRDDAVVLAIPAPKGRRSKAA